MADIDGLLRKVQALLAQADHPNTSAIEAETFRAKAEALMYKHRLDEAMFAQAQPMGVAPTWRNWPICDAASEYERVYRSVSSSIIQHFDCRGVFKQAARTEGYGWQYVMDACGYDSELRMAEMMWTEFMLAFQTKLEPKVDRSLSDQENAYRLRSAGLEGRRIAEMMYGQNTKALRSKVRNMFKREAERRGEDPRQLLGEGPVKGFRKSFADGFEVETWTRLAAMRRARGDAPATTMVMADRKTKVDEAFYEKYPTLRPVKVAGSLDWKDPRADCERCKRAKSGYCREHAWLRPAPMKEDRVNYAAYRRGRDAAASVDLGASPGRRLER